MGESGSLGEAAPAYKIVIMEKAEWAATLHTVTWEAGKGLRLLFPPG